MKSRSFISLLVWGLLAVFLMQTCFKDDTKPSEILHGFRAENFAASSGDGRVYVLENDLLRTEWRAVGAGCTKIELKQFKGENGEEFLTISESVQAQPPAPGETPGPQHHLQRDALRLFEPEGRLGVDLDSSEWTVEEIAGDDGASELLFTLSTDSGVELFKRVRLSSMSDLEGPAVEQYLVDVEVGASSTAEVQSSLVGDLSLRLATGGGMIPEPDSFYPNPYAGAARLEYDQVEELEVHNPSGSLPMRRDQAARWNGQFGFVVEGSKYFLSILRPVEAPFSGAQAEVLFDTISFNEGVLLGFSEEERQALTAVAAADAELRNESGRRPSAQELSDRSGVPAGQTMGWLQTWYQRNQQLRAKSWNRTSVAGVFDLHIGAAGSSGDSERFQWYLGPKDSKILERPGFRPMNTVVEQVDFGGNFFYKMFFTGAIAPFILWLIDLFHSLTGNWGIAIIMMTILVRIVLFPINRSSQVKMAAYQAKMAKVKPQLDQVNKKFAKDPQKRQEATMAIYRQHKLSPPIGGCLPIFLQFPVFIGLFAALRSSVVLREQPFMGWIQDLSRPDALIPFDGPIASFFPLSAVTSLNLLPIIMVVLWVAHQKSMPKPTDPQQAQMHKMMTIMPVLFGVMLYNYAAGLSLYMITSSGLGIFEQKFIKKRWPVPGAPTPLKA